MLIPSFCYSFLGSSLNFKVCVLLEGRGQHLKKISFLYGCFATSNRQSYTVYNINSKKHNKHKNKYMHYVAMKKVIKLSLDYKEGWNNNILLSWITHWGLWSSLNRPATIRSVDLCLTYYLLTHCLYLSWSKQRRNIKKTGLFQQY